MTETRVCKKCSTSLPISDFWISDKDRGYLRSSCKTCDRATARAWYSRTDRNREKAKATSRAYQQSHKRPPAVTRRASLKHKYGLSEADYTHMLASQDGKCALCVSPNCGRTAGKWSAGHFMVDHDHSTGRVRGLLCHKCNVRVGAYEGLLADVGVHKLVAYLTGASSDAPSATRT